MLKKDRNGFGTVTITFLICHNEHIMSDVEIRKQLDKILSSSAFSLSGVYKRLLEYLTDATLKGEKPKEFTIGHEVFGQEVNDPSTSRVRVSVFKLRKRLDKYYKDEGIHDELFFTIPKGGYSLEFVNRKDISHKHFMEGESRKDLIKNITVVRRNLIF